MTRICETHVFPWCLEDALEISASPISIIYSYMSCSAVFVLCYVCNPSTIFVCFIFLLTNLIAFNSCFLDIRLLTSEISSDKYSPHVRNSMSETIHIRNINRLKLEKSSINFSAALKCNNHFRGRKVRKKVNNLLTVFI